MDSNDLEFELQLWGLQFEQDKVDELNVAQFMSNSKSDSISNSSSNDQEIKELINSIHEPKKRLIIDSSDKESIPNNQTLPQSLPKVPQMSHKKMRLRKLIEKQYQDNCPICMNSLDDVNLICEIDPCKHMTCIDCIKEWAEKYKPQCPFCRCNFKNVWPLIEMKRSKQPLQLDLDKAKWCQEFDEFYNSSEDESDSHCMVCDQTHSQYLMLVCDGCDEHVCHTFCDPAILDVRIPRDNWYCLLCRISRFNYGRQRRQQ